MSGLKKDYKLKYITVSLILFLITAIGITACDENTGLGPGSESEEEENNIVEVAGEDGDLGTFSEVLIETELDGKLGSDEESFTAFAPVDSAFQKLPEGFWDGLSNDQKQEILNYHLLAGVLSKSDIQENESIETYAGGSIFIKAGNELELNHGTLVTEADKEASNGIIHKIDNVLLPDSYLTVFGVIEKRYSLKKFACYCTSGRTQLAEVLENEDSEFTVFVPTDEAFENFEKEVDNLSDSDLKHILNYHVIEQKILSDEFADGQTLTTLNGEDIMISVSNDGTISLNGQQAVVQEADLEGKNGVVYIIDSVVDPQADGS